MPKERPIIFSAEMVRAILDGRKTQTRRVMKPQPVDCGNGWFEWGYKYGAPKITSPRTAHWHATTWQREQGTAPIDEFCSYGQPGDKLWVREKFWEREQLAVIRYDAVGGYATNPEDNHERMPGTPYLLQELRAHELEKRVRELMRSWGWRPRSPIHMPRWASRITLELTEVRAERLQDITETDAMAEGCEPDADVCGSAIRPFIRLWDSLNAKRGHGWDANPWVWVLTFRRI